MDDPESCNVHQEPFAMFCHTCDILICTRCISRGPYSPEALHSEHIYIDLKEAYDMLQEDMMKLVSNFRDYIETQKLRRKDLQRRLQNLKLGLLRQETQTSRASKVVCDVICRRQRRYVHHVRLQLEPYIKTQEQIFRDKEFDIVSGEGVLGSTEAVMALPTNQAVHFIQRYMHIKQEIDRISQAEPPTAQSADDVTKSPPTPPSDAMNINVQHAKRSLRHVFSIPRSPPGRPRMLPSWCVVGATSACVTWSYRRQDNPAVFHITVAKATVTNVRTLEKWLQAINQQQVTMEVCLQNGDVIHDDGEAAKSSTNQTEVTSLSSANQTAANDNDMQKADGMGLTLTDGQAYALRRFSGGRAQFVLRDLDPQQRYLCVLQGQNAAGCGPASHCYVTTSVQQEQGFSFSHPGPWSCIGNQTRTISRVILVAMAVFVIVYMTVLVYESVMCERLAAGQLGRLNLCYPGYHGDHVVNSQDRPPVSRDDEIRPGAQGYGAQMKDMISYFQHYVLSYAYT